MKHILTLSMILGAGVGLAAFAPASSAHAGGFTNIKEASLKIEGIRYWRKKAGDATLGSVGRKMTPMAGKNYFQRVRTAPAGMFKVRTSKPYVVTTSQKNKLSGAVALNLGVVKGEVKGGGKSGLDANYAVVKLSIDTSRHSKGGLARETVRHPKHLAALEEQGNAGRMISEVWVLLRGSQKKLKCVTGGFNVSVAGGALKIEGSSKGCTRNTLKIPAGAVIAYSMVKVDDWDNSALVEPVECPDGFKRDVRKSSLTPMDQCVKTTFETGKVKCKLGALDKASNWSVQAKKGRDICKSKKGKPNKEVKCDGGGFNYIAQAGKDTCRKPKETTRDPKCPRGFDYDKKSTGNGGKDQCRRRGPVKFKIDSHDGM